MLPICLSSDDNKVQENGKALPNLEGFILHISVILSILSLLKQECEVHPILWSVPKAHFLHALSCRYGNTVERYGPEPYEIGSVSPVYIALR